MSYRLQEDSNGWKKTISWVLGIAFLIWLIRDCNQAKYQLEEDNRSVIDQFVPDESCRECIQKYMDNKRAYEEEIAREKAIEDKLNREPR